MNKILTILSLCLTMGMLSGQDNYNLDLVANVELTETGNDIWGYVDSTGLEYAIMGTTEATYIFSLEDPANPIERAKITGVTSVWRDIKSYKDHIYVTTDQGADGLTIVDMSEAPENITFRLWKPTFNLGGNDEVLRKCHNIYIDTDQGYAYLAGCNNGVGGVIILDLNENEGDPIYMSATNEDYSHDAYVLNDRLYASEIYKGEFAIYDVSDKTNPVYLAGEKTTTLFTHNIWASHDGNFIYTTDERANAYVDAFDISDLDNIKRVDSYQPLETAGSGVIPHNTHFLNDVLYTSWYTDGIVLTDVSDPSNMVEVGVYDTFEGDGTGFNGCWGAYPFLPSGLLLASDMNTGLYIFQPVDNKGNNGIQKASLLQGTATDANSGQAIPNVNVEILVEKQNLALTDALGTYKTGTHLEGTQQVVFSHPNYDADTLSVELISGEYATLDVVLGSQILEGIVVDENGDIIENAIVQLVNKSTGTATEIPTDADGNFLASVSGSAVYDLNVAKWGYKPTTTEASANTEQNPIVLESGYQDDFFSDLGWVVAGTAETGMWELGNPQLATNNNLVLVSDGDLSDDIGNRCYLTEINNGGLGVNDIDDGRTILTSPAMDFTGNNIATIGLHYFYVFLENDNPFDDSFVIELSNGISEIVLFETSEFNNEWTKLELEVMASELEFTEDMKLIIRASDEGNPHFTEVQVDGFTAELSLINATEELPANAISVYPNPVKDLLSINIEDSEIRIERINLYDITGKLLNTYYVTTDNPSISLINQSAGIYLIEMVAEDGKVLNKKISKI